MCDEENVVTKLEPRCMCCLSEMEEKFSTENMTRIVQDLMHAEVSFSANFACIGYNFYISFFFSKIAATLI